jgi:hypothetical protein
MATRMNMLKLLLETRSLADLTNRRPLARQPGLLTLQLRPSGPRRGPFVKNRRTLRVDMQDPPDIPHPVKINHVKPVALSAPPRESAHTVA